MAILSKGDTYGYKLAQDIKNIMCISESTLYPVLRRLEQSSYLTTYDNNFQGRNRRYYSITNSGHQKLDECLKEWDSYKKQIDQIILGEFKNG